MKIVWSYIIILKSYAMLREKIQTNSWTSKYAHRTKYWKILKTVKSGMAIEKPVSILQSFCQITIFSS